MALPAIGQEGPPSEVTLFKNVNIFDGKSEKLLEGYDVLVVKNLIEKIGEDIQLSDTYEIDAKSGEYKVIGQNLNMHDFHTYRDWNLVVTVYESVKKIRKKSKSISSTAGAAP